MIAANKSAIGPEYKIPSMPINNGREIINGNNNRICLVNAKKIPLYGLPIEVKNVEVIG